MDKLFFLPAWPPVAGFPLRIALFLLVATLLGELGHRRLRLPRMLGWAVAGFACGPFALTLFSRADLFDARHWVSIAIGFLLFELGQRVDLAWLRRNPWMLASSIAESTLAFLAVLAALWLLGTPPLLASMAAAIAVATGPAVVLTMSKELGSQGQVTERMLLLTALNNVYAYLAASVLLAWLHSEYLGGWDLVILHPLYLIAGSIALAAVFAGLALALLRLLGRWRDAQLVGMVALVLLAVATAVVLNLSVALVALGMGAMSRTFDASRRFVHLDFAALGRVLVMVLVGLTAAGIDPAIAVGGMMAGVVLIAARHGGRLVVLLALARPSGLAVRKASLLALTLTPMSAVALVLVDQTALLYPEFGPSLSSIMISAIAVLEIAGPLLTAYALRRAGEALQSADTNEAYRRA